MRLDYITKSGTRLAAVVALLAILVPAAAFADTIYTVSLQAPLTCAINCTAFSGAQWSLDPARDTLTIGTGPFAATGADIFVTFSTPPNSAFGNWFQGVPTLSNDAIGMGWINNSAANLALVDPGLAALGNFEPIQVAQLNPLTGGVSYQFDGFYTLTAQTAATPEPGTIWLLGTVLAGLFGTGLRRKRPV